MKPLYFAYGILGFATGFVLLLHFLTSLPDGKLYLVFCDVGQGDAIYARLPDGRDMLVDGGPNEKVIGCLSRHMPFWDRTIDLVFLTHPERDHMQGLNAVIARYSVGSFVTAPSPVSNELHSQLLTTVAKEGVPIRRVTAGSAVEIGDVAIAVLWPSDAYITRISSYAVSPGSAVLGATANLNEGSLVTRMTYGDFSLLLPGDADTAVESEYLRNTPLATRPVTVLKVPHHGSKTGISESFLKRLQPDLAILSVGKNSYGHPSPIVLGLLADNHIRVLRTDQEGDIQIISDGDSWKVVPSGMRQ